jgi:hypothetical protein
VNYAKKIWEMKRKSIWILNFIKIKEKNIGRREVELMSDYLCECF